jgi:hypothetical protein
MWLHALDDQTRAVARGDGVRLAVEVRRREIFGAAKGELAIARSQRETSAGARAPACSASYRAPDESAINRSSASTTRRSA